MERICGSRTVLALVALVVTVVGGVSILLTGGAAKTEGHTRHSGVPAPRAGAPSRQLSGPARARQSAVALERRAVDRALGYTSYVALAGRRRRDVALTFDDGPGPATRQILAILHKLHTPATFFLIGRSVRSYPRLVAAEAQAGFAVGDHTETHPFMSQLSRSAQAAEIRRAAVDIRRAGAPYPRLFRPPYGAFDRRTLALLRAQRMLMVLWSVDTSDFRRPGEKQIVRTAVSGAQAGAIILMHDGGGNRTQTVAALPHIVQRLRARGFRLVSVPQLIADDPPPHGQPPPRPLSGRV